jgi:hypothetical protein
MGPFGLKSRCRIRKQTILAVEAKPVSHPGTRKFGPSGVVSIAFALEGDWSGSIEYEFYALPGGRPDSKVHTLLGRFSPDGKPPLYIYRHYTSSS